MRETREGQGGDVKSREGMKIRRIRGKGRLLKGGKAVIRAKQRKIFGER